MDINNEEDMDGYCDKGHYDIHNKTYFRSHNCNTYWLWVVELGVAHVMFITQIVCGRM